MVGGVVGGSCVGRDVGFVGFFVGGGSVGGDSGVRVGIVCRNGLCPDEAHSSGPAIIPMIAVATSADSSIHIVRFMMLSSFFIVP